VDFQADIDSFIEITRRISKSPLRTTVPYLHRLAPALAKSMRESPEFQLTREPSPSTISRETRWQMLQARSALYQNTQFPQ